MTKREIAWLMAGTIAVGIFLGVALSCVIYLSNAAAEDGLVYRCWILCNPEPGNEVMIREAPRKGSAAVGAAACGKQMWTDWREKDGWLHLVDVNNETGEGWVSMAYVVFSEPVTGERKAEVTGCKRVACRQGIDGKRKRWAKRGATVTIYAEADGWAVTDEGYIQTEYLGEV
jgi:hypothetical protein